MKKMTIRKNRAAQGALIAIACAAAFAGQTQIWTQGEYADFERGAIKNLSMRSDGLLSLAPHSQEIFDTSAAYHWALAQDSKGNLYAAEVAPGSRAQKFLFNGLSSTLPANALRPDQRTPKPGVH